ncbi:MAG: hypothetical protein AUJ51_12255 [Elusimicrobia bacterium CG1_02_56_21]|nr:MAG: hypothetical protein AUJ51_12255 [Elusimicrobia bacterium CG1_02_56_21]
MDPLVDLYEGIDLFPAEDQIKEFSASPRPALPGARSVFKFKANAPTFGIIGKMNGGSGSRRIFRQINTTAGGELAIKGLMFTT